MKTVILPVVCLIVTFCQSIPSIARQMTIQPFSQEKLLENAHQRENMNGTYLFTFINRDDSLSSIKVKKPLVYGIIGSYSMGLMGALIASGFDRKCSGSRDVFSVCGTNERTDRIGYMVGSTIGTFISYWYQTREFHESTLVPNIVGSLAGAAIGFYLSKETNGFVGMLCPPIATYVSLTIFSREF